MTLSELLQMGGRTILLDGAMGTQLAGAGIEMSGRANITHPEAVLAIHREYSECGVDLLITNTLTMNRVNIESHHMGLDVTEVNLAGARLARAAAREGQYVVGDLSSTGKLLKPHGELSEDDAYAAFKEQAAILAEGGVDGFIVETMFDLREAISALRACREVSGMPVIVSMTFATAQRGGRTIMGDSAEGCAGALAGAGALALGTNCGSLDPFQMAQVVAFMKKSVSLPILAQPNAGSPKMVDGRTFFDMTPQEFAIGVRECVRAGASMIGGCCGTSPAHIRAVIDLLRQSDGLKESG